MRILRRLLVFCLFLFPYFGKSQNCGLPFITNYDSKIYEGGTDNWAIVQDRKGIIYVGNSTGVVEYDGVSWRITPLSNQSIVRSLAVDTNGVVYAGGVGDFGYLSPDAFGNNVFVSLLDKVNKEDRVFGDVAKIYATPQGIFFSTFKKIFLYKNNTISSWEPENQFHFSFFLDNNFFVLERGKGFLSLINNELKYIPGTSLMGSDKVYAMLPFEKGMYLLSSRENGLFIFNPVSLDSSKVLTPFKTSADDYLVESQVYHGIQISDTLYSFATLRGGVVFLGKSGKYFTVLNKNLSWPFS